MGGAVAAIEDGWMQAQIEDAAYRRGQTTGRWVESVVVGVNRYAAEGGQAIPVLEVDPALEEEQCRRLTALAGGTRRAISGDRSR